MLLVVNIAIGCNIRQSLTAINQATCSDYILTDTTLEVSGKQYEVIFSLSSVQIKNSYRITEKGERLAVLMAIRTELQRRGLSTRKITSMEGEWVAHNIAYRTWKNDAAKHVDLDYKKDRRWYVALISDLLGSMGV